jgi:hypothetical protein
MKKLSIILLALALALVFTVPAMAIHIGDSETPEGALGISGRYQFDGEAIDIDGDKTDFYDDDLDLAVTLMMGSVKAFVGLEIADTNPYEGNSHAGKSPITDNYYIEWAAMDNLKLKIGEYGLAFAREIGTTDAGERNIQLTYSMDALDISAAIMVADDGNNGAMAATPSNPTTSAGEDDNNTIMLKLSAKEAGPFTTLDVVSYTQMNDVATSAGASAENSYTGIDLALPLGPVSFAFEYGANGGDLDGTFMLALIGLEELVGFDVTIGYFQSSDDYLTPYDGNDWSPVKIYGDNINGDMADTSAIWVEFGYGVNDKLSLNAAALVQAENDAGDAWGNEFDVGLKYKLADNVSWAASYASYSQGDADPVAQPDDLDYTELWHRIEFKF